MMYTYKKHVTAGYHHETRVAIALRQKCVDILWQFLRTWIFCPYIFVAAVAYCVGNFDKEVEQDMFYLTLLCLAQII